MITKKMRRERNEYLSQEYTALQGIQKREDAVYEASTITDGLTQETLRWCPKCLAYRPDSHTH